MYTSKIEVYHSKRMREKKLFSKEFNYSANTATEALDMMAYGSLELYEAAKKFVEQNYDLETYDFEYDSWYIHVHHPTLTKFTLNERDNTGGGGKLHSLLDIVNSAAHYRYMEINYFMRMVLYSDSFKKYSNETHSRASFEYYDEPKEIIQKNLSGVDAQKIINKMGKDYELFLMDEAQFPVARKIKFDYVDKYGDRSILNSFEKIAYSFYKKNRS